MPNSIRTTSNTTPPAHQASHGLDDGLSIVTPLIQLKVIDTLAMIRYGREGSK